MKYEIKYSDGSHGSEQTLASAIHAVAYAYQSTIEQIHDLSPSQSPVEKLDVKTVNGRTVCRLEAAGNIVAEIVQNEN